MRILQPTAADKVAFEVAVKKRIKYALINEKGIRESSELLEAKKPGLKITPEQFFKLKLCNQPPRP